LNCNDDYNNEQHNQHDSNKTIDFYQNIRKGVVTEDLVNITGYILKIGKNKLINYKNEQKKLGKKTEFKAEDVISIDEYDAKIDKAVRFILNKMSEGCKNILNLYYFQKKSMNEIALELGYKNSDVVKSQKNRCISSISSKVNKIYFQDEE
jgi:RNA polymerase sigma-70 factor (ECF subfamily)